MVLKPTISSNLFRFEKKEKKTLEAKRLDLDACKSKLKKQRESRTKSEVRHNQDLLVMKYFKEIYFQGNTKSKLVVENAPDAPCVLLFVCPDGRGTA